MPIGGAVLAVLSFSPQQAVGQRLPRVEAAILLLFGQERPEVGLLGVASASIPGAGFPCDWRSEPVFFIQGPESPTWETDLDRNAARRVEKAFEAMEWGLSLFERSLPLPKGHDYPAAEQITSSPERFTVDTDGPSVRLFSAAIPEALACSADGRVAAYFGGRIVTADLGMNGGEATSFRGARGDGAA